MHKYNSLFGSNAKRLVEALVKSLAIIEFEPDGTILCANENFCGVLGYSPQEIVGQEMRHWNPPPKNICTGKFLF